MTQEARPYESIDINAGAEKVTGPSGKGLVTRVSWNPASAANAEHQARVQAQLQQEREMQELRATSIDDTLIGLTEAVRALNARLMTVEAHLGVSTK